MVKVTTMEIKVDLECHKCRKKIKKVLCKIHQIHDQIYDEKANTVKITVVCCSPEKIKEKICREGGKTVKDIKICPEESPKPKPPKEPGKQLQPTPSPPAPPPQPNPQPRPPAPPLPPPNNLNLVPAAYPRRVCCTECSEGRGGGPCHGRPPPTPPCWEGYGRPVYEIWGWGYCCTYGDCRRCYGRCYARRCDYPSEECASGCTFM